MVTDVWGKGSVAAVDGVLNIAKHMREANLVLASQLLLVLMAE